MPDLTVLTSITGGKDLLHDDQVTGGAKFTAYVSEFNGSTVWEERPAYERFWSDRRNSRIVKILSHQFCDTQYSIWLDGNVALRADPSLLVIKWLDNYDVAVFRHPDRKCVYEEAQVCIDQRLDEPKIIKQQIRKYLRAGYAKDQGLAECSVIARRHTSQVIKFNNAWWTEYCAHSVRDQISFMYSANCLRLRINWITPAARMGNTDFDNAPHLTPQPEPGWQPQGLFEPEYIEECCTDSIARELRIHRRR